MDIYQSKSMGKNHAWIAIIWNVRIINTPKLTYQALNDKWYET